MGSTCNPFQLHIIPGSPDQDSHPSFSSRLGLKLLKKGCQFDLIAHPTHTCVGLLAKALAFGGTTLPPAPGCLRIVIVAKGRAEPCPPVVVVTVGARPEPCPLHSSSSCWGAQPEPCPSRPRHRGESTAGAVPLVIFPSLSSRCPRGHHRKKWRHAGAQVHRRHGGTAGAAPRPPQSSSLQEHGLSHTPRVASWLCARQQKQCRLQAAHRSTPRNVRGGVSER